MAPGTRLLGAFLAKLGGAWPYLDRYSKAIYLPMILEPSFNFILVCNRTHQSLHFVCSLESCILVFTNAFLQCFTIKAFMK